MGFSERGMRLIPDSVYGCRRWSVGPQGSLFSFSAGYKWVSGWQTATCHGRRHHLGTVEGMYCGCGFWAYWSKNGEHVRIEGTSTNHVVGIIEGKGKAVVGNSGFRIAEARIVALVMEPPKLLRLAWFLPVLIGAVIGFYLTLSVLAFSGLSVGAGAYYAGATGALGVLLGWHMTKFGFTKKQKLAAKYPEVKFYSSWSAALRDFPVEKPDWKRER